MQSHWQPQTKNQEGDADGDGRNAGHRASGLRIIITRREVIPIRPATLPVRRRGASQERSSLGCPEGDAGPKSKKGRGSQAARMIVPL